MDCHLRYAHLCFCSAQIRRVLHCRFTPLTATPTRPLAMWSPSGGPCGITSTPTHAWVTASSECFRTLFIDIFQNDSAKAKFFDETDKKWNGVCCGTFPFTTRRSRLDHTCCLDKSELETCLRFPVSRNRNWKLQFGVVLSHSSSSNSSIRCCPPTPRNSTKAAHQLL